MVRTIRPTHTAKLMISHRRDVSFALVTGILGLFSGPPSIAELGLQQYQASTTFFCTVAVQSSLTVHVADANGIPVPSATVLLNGTYVCNGVAYSSNFSGTTDLDGNVAFGLVPHAKYNVTVILPRSLAGESIAVSQITAPPPTMSATTTIAVPEFPVSFALVLIAAILLATAMVKRRKSARKILNEKAEPV